MHGNNNVGVIGDVAIMIWMESGKKGKRNIENLIF